MKRNFSKWIFWGEKKIWGREIGGIDNFGVGRAECDCATMRLAEWLVTCAVTWRAAKRWGNRRHDSRTRGGGKSQRAPYSARQKGAGYELRVLNSEKQRKIKRELLLVVVVGGKREEKKHTATTTVLLERERGNNKKKKRTSTQWAKECAGPIAAAIYSQRGPHKIWALTCTVETPVAWNGLACARRPSEELSLFIPELSSGLFARFHHHYHHPRYPFESNQWELLH